MKIRNKKKEQEWWFFENGKGAKKFRYKTEMMKYINRLDHKALNGAVRLHMCQLGSSYDIREWSVWYDEKKYQNNNIFEIVLRQLDFRGKRFIHKPGQIEKDRVRYFIYSDKIISLMCYIGDGNYTDNNLSNLLVLFKKRGFKDFEIEDSYDLQYYNRDNHQTLDVFNEWWYWSDRCNFLRIKIIHDLIKRERPEAFNMYLKKIQ